MRRTSISNCASPPPPPILPPPPFREVIQTLKPEARYASILGWWVAPGICWYLQAVFPPVPAHSRMGITILETLTG